MGFFDSLMKSITGTTSAAKKYSSPVPQSTYRSQVPSAASRYTSSVPQSTYQSQVPRAATASVPASTIRSQVPTAGQSRLGVTPNPGQQYWEENNPGYTPPGTGWNGGSSGGGGGGGTSGGGGGGGTGGGGGGGGSIAPPPKPAPPPRPVRPTRPTFDTLDYDVLTVPDAQSDATYQSEVTGLTDALNKYIQKDAKARKDYRAEFDTTLGDLGWDANSADWQERGKGSFGNSYVANENDFGSRGASTSGIYQDAINNMRQEYDRRRTDMIDQKQKWSENQDISKQEFEDTTARGKDTSRANAIARLAAKYNISGDMVGWDKGKKYARRIDSGAEGNKKLSEWAPTELSEYELETAETPEKKAYKKQVEDWKKKALAWDAQYG